MSIAQFFKNVFSFWRKPAPPQDAPLNSLVWLLREPRLASEETILILARKVLGEELIDVLPLPKDPNLSGQMYMIVAFPRRGFGVIFASQPYVEDMTGVAETITEVRRKSLFQQHSAWLAIDLMGDDTSRESWDIAAKLMAELAGPDCLLLYAPSNGRMEPYTDELIEVLRGPNSLSKIGFDSNPPVVSFQSDSEELEKAEEEARTRWPEFVDAFKNRTASQEDFAVKAPFDTADGEVEHMWVMVEEVEGDRIRGILGNEPVNVPHLKIDSPIELQSESISDWVYSDNGNMVGGFSMKLLLGNKDKSN